MSGVIRSLTSAVTTAPKAAPMTTATARSRTLPRNRNSLKPFISPLQSRRVIRAAGGAPPAPGKSSAGAPPAGAGLASLALDGDLRIDLGGAPRGEEAGDEGHGGQDEADAGEDLRVAGRGLEEGGGEHAGGRPGQRQGGGATPPH